MILVPMKYPFASLGSIVLTGFEQSLQGAVARNVAAKVIQRGANVVYLVESKQANAAVVASMADLLHGLESDLTAINRVHIIDDVNEYRTAQALADAIKAKIAQPVIVIRDASHFMIPLDLTQWLPIADELALILDAPVFTATHHGPSGPPAPKYTDMPADEVWTATAGLNLALTLKRWAPRTEVVRLRGSVLHGGAYVFENETAANVLGG